MERVQVHGFQLDIDPAQDPFGVVKGILKGWYEASEVKVARALLKPEDRVVELGAGLGMVTCALSAIVGPANVIAFEPNAEIAPRARHHLALNGFDTRVEEGLCRPRACLAQTQQARPESPAKARFRLAKAFWASGLEAEGRDGGDGPLVDVAVRPLEDVLAAHRASILVMDIEGGEIEILEEADLTGLRAIALETHEGMVGRGRTNAAIRAACARGFDIDFALTQDGIVVLRRAEEATA
ncbi:MAG: FkbM family methyltransferase [Pseudomonadota bacterium]